MADLPTRQPPGTAGQGTERLVFEGQSAAGQARQHVGNSYTSTNNHYTIAKRRSDETLREDGRNRAFLASAAEGQLQRLKHLYQLGVDIDHSDDSGFTALHHAALSGFEDVVEFLWEKGCDVNAQSLDFGTPLCVAALKGREKVAAVLIRSRANVNAIGRYCGTPLHCACYAGHVPTIETLVGNHADVFKTAPICYKGRTAGDTQIQHVLSQVGRPSDSFVWSERYDCQPTFVAVLSGNSQAVASLFKAGASVHELSRSWVGPPAAFEHAQEKNRSAGITLLMAAALKGHTTLCSFLIHSGASVDAKDSKDRTALRFAAKLGDAACVKTLLDNGASPSAPIQNRWTPLMWAASGNHTECVRMLSGVDVRRAALEYKHEDGYTALYLASRSGHSESVHILLDAGAEVDPQTIRGDTPASAALVRGHIDTVVILLDHGADLLRVKEGGSLLLKAFQKSDFLRLVTPICDVVRQILLADPSGCVYHRGICDGPILECNIAGDVGDQLLSVCNRFVNLDRKINFGSTLLHLAAEEGAWQVVKVLLRLGADPTARDRQRNMTPLDYAASNSHAMVAIVLIVAGVAPGEREALRHAISVGCFPIMELIAVNIGRFPEPDWTAILDAADDSEKMKAFDAFLDRLGLTRNPSFKRGKDTKLVSSHRSPSERAEYTSGAAVIRKVSTSPGHSSGVRVVQKTLLMDDGHGDNLLEHPATAHPKPVERLERYGTLAESANALQLPRGTRRAPWSIFARAGAVRDNT